MDNSLKLALGIVLGALAIGIVGYPALGNMMGSGTGAATGMMGSNMMNGIRNAGMMGFGGPGMVTMHNAMMGALANGTNGTFDMNQMHKLMHGEDPDFDMNAMHQRMINGNLTQEDIQEMREHCPMMGGGNIGNQ